MRKIKSPILRRLAQIAATAFLSLILILLSAWFSVAYAGKPQTETSFPAISSFVRGADQDCGRYGRCAADAKTVFAALQVNSLDASLETPNKYLIRGWFNLNWLPAAHPNWEPSDLVLGCRSPSSGCKFSGWQNTFNTDSGQRRIWGARFELEIEERDTFFNYPFDQHWIKIVIQPNDVKTDQFINVIDLDSFKVELSSNLFLNHDTSFNIDYATVGRKNNSILINAVTPDRSNLYRSPAQANVIASDEKAIGKDSQDLPLDAQSDYLTTSISFHLVRRTPAALAMIITPLLLILLTTIIGFHWRESSPASRFGASGLLSAVSLYFASRVFRPAVDYLVFSDIWFLLDYIAITINSALLVWLFRHYKHRAEQKRDGKTPAPAWKAEIMLTFWNTSGVIVVIAILFVISQRMLQPPSIPIDFLAGNSNREDFGTSVVKVIEQNELLPSFYLLPISSQADHPQS